jgi:hypothetical protein
VHADFKPANVILTEAGEIKVIDFGIARAFHKPGDGEMEATRFDPGSLGALTPTYASPEMLEHREPDPRDDIYALACIVYEMLTGRHPFGRRQANEARDGGLALERRSLTRKQWKALKSALAFDRDRRTSSVEQFFKEINPECNRVPGAIAAGVGVFVLLGGFSAFQYLGITDMPLALFDESHDPPQFVARTDIIETVASDESAAPAITRDAAMEQPVEPVEVAAVAPEPLAAIEEKPPAEEVRQALKDILNSYPCSAMVPFVNEGKVEVHGYINQAADIDELSGRLHAVAGVDAVDTQLAGLTESQCAVVEHYRPYWIANKENESGTSIKPGNPGGEFRGGEPLVVELTTPPYDSFVNIDYYSLDGHVVHMVPSPRVEANQAPANYTATLGDLDQWIVSEPFGKEMVVIITTPVALFGELRDEYERAEDYLHALQERLAGIDDRSVARDIAADFVLINTRPE